MLKVSRREKESITLFTGNGKITISIEKIRGRQVRVGIHVPESVRVARSEILRSDDASYTPVASQQVTVLRKLVQLLKRVFGLGNFSARDSGQVSSCKDILPVPKA